MGSGPEKENLLKIKKAESLNNVHFFNPVNKSMISDVVYSIDASIIPLKNIPLFEGAIPSKIFENLAMEKPIILGVKGEAKELFIDKGKCGLYFEPENKSELIECLNMIINNPLLKKTYGENGRAFAKKYFDRDQLANKFHRKILETHENFK